MKLQRALDSVGWLSGSGYQVIIDSSARTASNAKSASTKKAASKPSGSTAKKADSKNSNKAKKPSR